MIRLQSLRRKAAQRQGGCCWYCRAPMAASGPLACTAEHLVPRGEGGRNTAANIVAACRFCNAHRHRLKVPPTPDRFQQMVAQRIRLGRWNSALVRAPAGVAARVLG